MRKPKRQLFDVDPYNALRLRGLYGRIAWHTKVDFYLGVRPLPTKIKCRIVLHERYPSYDV